jgi:hypothetical protein
MSLHLVTQNGQPFGSVRRCCEMCGLAVCSIVDKVGEALTENEKQYNDSPLNCWKELPPTHPALPVAGTTPSPFSGN